MAATSVPAATEASDSLFDRIHRWIDEAEPVDLALRFSMVALVVASHYEPVVMALAALGAVVLLSNRRLLHHPVPWLVGGAALALWQLPRWYTFDNHVWLTTYWVLAVGLSLAGPFRQRTLAVNGRLMVGLIFALAAAWKIGSADFRSFDFFHYSLLGDDRFSFVAEYFGGIDDASRAADQAATRELAGRPEEWVRLHSTDSARRVATVFSVWGAVIEVLIAVTWLLPVGRRPWLRPATLLAFVATTYLVVPVGGFGCLLMAMGLTQVRERGWERTAYCVAFALLLCYGPIWQLAFGP